MRKNIMLLTGPWLLIGVPARGLGIAAVKPGCEWLVAAVDVVITLVFLLALMWPWLVLPFKCRHETVHIERRNAKLCDGDWAGKELWKDVHGVLNFVVCSKCGHVFQGGFSQDCIYGEKHEAGK